MSPVPVAPGGTLPVPPGDLVVADTGTATPSASATVGVSSVASPDPAYAFVGTLLVVVLAALLLRRFR